MRHIAFCILGVFPICQPTLSNLSSPALRDTPSVLRGRIVFEGQPPIREDLAPRIVESHDGRLFLKGDTRDRTWLVSPKGGVQNVVVWLRAAKDCPFAIPDHLRIWRRPPVVIDQAHTSFEPRVVVLYPSYWDPTAGTQVPTGQSCKVVCTIGPMFHNVAWEGDDKLVNPGKNEKRSRGEAMPVVARPALPNRTGEDRITMCCALHRWMRGYAWVFDHPYAAVSDENGRFEIADVPIDTELEVVFWHESMGKQPIAEKKTLRRGNNEFQGTLTK